VGHAVSPYGVTASVLIVDDHDGTLDTLSAHLRTAGFETVTASTGREATELAISNCFEVILIDLHLPDIPGLDVVRALKLSGVGSRMVIMTVFPEPGTPVDVEGAGADGYVDGLLWDTEVVEVVRQAMAGPFQCAIHLSLPRPARWEEYRPPPLCRSTVRGRLSAGSMRIWTKFCRSPSSQPAWD
jgi:DNA-binding NarL/FixJ family response regulator